MRAGARRRPGPAARSGGPALRHARPEPAEIRVVAALAAELHQPVDGVQALKGVLAVKKTAFVLPPKVPFDICPRQRRPAEDDGVTLEAALVELEQVVAHY